MPFQLPSLTGTSSFLIFLLGFGFLIFIHELGHFVVAKLVGIKVTQFAIGFGHSVLSWRKGLGFRAGSTEAEYEKRIEDHLRKQHNLAEGQVLPQWSTTDRDRAVASLGLGETEYRLNWMPLGGYVKMLGQEDLDPTARSDDPRSFNTKPVWARACVISAGVVMNLIFAVIFFIACFLHGVEFPPAVVGAVAPGSPAATTFAVGHDGDEAYRGLLPGDRVLKINDERIPDFMGIATSTVLGSASSDRVLKVQREGEDAPLTYKLLPMKDPDTGLLSLGIAPGRTLTLAAIREESTLYKQGVRADMTVTAVDGKPVSTYGEYARAITSAHGNEVQVEFDHGKVTVPLSADMVLPDTGDYPNLLGLVPATRIGKVMKDSPAQKAGVQTDDLVAEVNGQAWPTATQLQKAVKDAGTDPVSLTVERKGELVTLEPVAPHNGLLGVSLGVETDQVIIGQYLSDTPAAALNLTGGSRILAIDGTDVADWSQMERALQQACSKLTDGGKVGVRFELAVKDRPVMQEDLPITADQSRLMAKAAWVEPLGWMFGDLREPVKAGNPYDALVIGLQKTHHFMLQTYQTILRIAQGSVPLKGVSGPVGIIHAGTTVTSRGWPYLCFFLGLISVNLVVLNFLPIPIVDGGLMVFLIIEKIKGSPVNAKIQNAASLVGIALIGSLVLFVTYHDITRLFTGG
ncbi:MAG: PDZ domain-containing protein [Phycisphaera sp.]|nr:PDZ domain-containing protein [Phycisphaera sp.]